LIEVRPVSKWTFDYLVGFNIYRKEVSFEEMFSENERSQPTPINIQYLKDTQKKVLDSGLEDNEIAASPPSIVKVWSYLNILVKNPALESAIDDFFRTVLDTTIIGDRPNPLVRSRYPFPLNVGGLKTKAIPDLCIINNEETVVLVNEGLKAKNDFSRNNLIAQVFAEAIASYQDEISGAKIMDLEIKPKSSILMGLCDGPRFLFLRATFPVELPEKVSLGIKLENKIYISQWPDTPLYLPLSGQFNLFLEGLKCWTAIINSHLNQ